MDKICHDKIHPIKIAKYPNAIDKGNIFKMLIHSSLNNKLKRKTY